MPHVSKKALHFNLRDFILEMEKRDSLWANKHKNDRFRRAQDWMDLVRTLSKNDWDMWSKEEKDEMIQYAQKKWRSIRDNVVKQVRRDEKVDLGCTKQRKAPYVYFDLCKFLLAEIPSYGRSFVWTKMNKHIQNIQKEKQNIKEETNSSSSDDAVDADDPLAMYDKFDDSDSDDEPLVKTPRKTASSSRTKSSPAAAKKATTSVVNTRKRKRVVDTFKSEPTASTSSKSELTSAVSHAPEISKQISQSVGNRDRGMNEDEAFFLSLMPSVQKLSEEQKMEFRISVLKLLKSIKHNTNTNDIVEELLNL